VKRRPKKLKAHRSARVELAEPDATGRRLRTEQTAAGEQHVVAGAEHISPAEVVRRRALAPLTPKAKQQPADHGPFSDESKQIDFIDQPMVSAQADMTASVSFMITQHQKEQLRDLGYTGQQIRKMKPEDAHAILKDRTTMVRRTG
jgi:hypothetical protein